MLHGAPVLGGSHAVRACAYGQCSVVWKYWSLCFFYTRKFLAAVDP